MVIQRAAGGSRASLLAVLQQEPSEGFTGAGFGIAWSLIMSIAGWVLQGVGLGLSVRDAIRGAKEQVPAGEVVTPTDVRTVAQEVAARDPRGRGVDFWEGLLEEGLKPETPCPTGFYRDPKTGACLEEKEAGMFEKVPGWGWLLIGLGGFWFMTQSGMLKMAGR